jgi:hypothetical protein
VSALTELRERWKPYVTDPKGRYGFDEEGDRDLIYEHGYQDAIKEAIQLLEAEPATRCYLDGNALCIVGPDFVNLQESPAMFIELTSQQIAEFREVVE